MSPDDQPDRQPEAINVYDLWRQLEKGDVNRWTQLINDIVFQIVRAKAENKFLSILEAGASSSFSFPMYVGEWQVVFDTVEGYLKNLETDLSLNGMKFGGIIES
jgi:hypothetical protein